MYLCSLAAIFWCLYNRTLSQKYLVDTQESILPKRWSIKCMSSMKKPKFDPQKCIKPGMVGQTWSESQHWQGDFRKVRSQGPPQLHIEFKASLGSMRSYSEWEKEGSWLLHSRPEAARAATSLDTSLDTSLLAFLLCPSHASPLQLQTFLSALEHTCSVPKAGLAYSKKYWGLH